MNFLCAQCDTSFKSLEELDLHERGGHISRGDSIAAVPPNIEFEQTMAMIEADKRAKQIQEATAKSAAPPEQPSIKTQPLRLEYKFTGVDSDGHEVTTIMLDTDAGYYANAFCLVENKQIKSVRVDKLETEALTPKINAIIAKKEGKK